MKSPGKSDGLRDEAPAERIMRVFEQQCRCGLDIKYSNTFNGQETNDNITSRRFKAFISS